MVKRRRKTACIPRPMVLGMVTSVVLMAAAAHHAVATASDLAQRNRTVPGFIGVAITALVGGLMAYGKFTMDLGRASRVGQATMRGQVRDLVGVGAVAVLSLVLHMAWAGTQVAASDATVPGTLGSTVMEGMAGLGTYGVWVLECTRGPRPEPNPTAG